MTLTIRQKVDGLCTTGAVLTLIPALFASPMGSNNPLSGLLFTPAVIVLLLALGTAIVKKAGAIMVFSSSALLCAASLILIVSLTL